MSGYTYMRPSQSDSPALGSLNGARKWKRDAAAHVREVRSQLRAAKIGGARGRLQLDLLKAQEHHRECLRIERDALREIERRANELGRTTIRSNAAQSQSEDTTHGE